mmetsp:Transcript_90270/g.292120  ORF Transcript_90270/g.292120 Transcript_90270/m.292120 type:complete len:709 (-) Transcript_90270:139-2265(-)
MARSMLVQLGTCLVFYFPCGSCSVGRRSSRPTVEFQAHEDRLALVQESVQVRRQRELPRGVAEMIVDGMDKSTVLHATSVHRLPGASSADWNGDATKTVGGILHSRNGQTDLHGALLGSDVLHKHTHGVYGGSSTLEHGRPPYLGSFRGAPNEMKITHAQKSSDGGFDVTSVEHQDNLPGHSSLPAPLRSAKPGGGKAAEPETPSLTLAGVEGPFAADSLTLAFRHKDATGSSPIWGNDDVLAAGGQVFSAGDAKGGYGGFGGFSSKDGGFHLAYGSGFSSEQKPLFPASGGSVGTVQGKPGKMDITHISPAKDGGVDITSVRSRTVHVAREELERVLGQGSSLTVPPLSEDEGLEPPSTTPLASTSMTQAASTSTTQGSSTSAAQVASTPVTTGAATAWPPQQGTTVTATTAQPGPDRNVWHDIASSVGDVTEAGAQVPLGVSEDWAVGIAVDVSDAITLALTSVKGKADTLLNTTVRSRELLVQDLDVELPKLVPVLETALYRAFDGILGEWRSYRASVSNATNRITSGLQAGEQRPLAQRLAATVQSTQDMIDSLMRRISAAMDEVPGISQLGAGQIAVRLERMNGVLYDASRSLEQYGPAFERAFQELLDRVSDATSGLAAPERAQRALAGVQQLSTAIVWRVRAAARELVVAGHQAIARVADGIQLPAVPWPPANVAAKSAAGGQANLAALAAVLCLRAAQGQ